MSYIFGDVLYMYKWIRSLYVYDIDLPAFSGTHHHVMFYNHTIHVQ